MKKLLLIAAFAAFALTSCQQEKDIRGGAAGEKNEIAFSLQSAVTRSGEAISPVISSGRSISLGKIDGFELFLDETVEDLNICAAETRGTPVYTENVGYLYAGKLGVHTDGAGGVEASYALLADDPTPDGWIYQHTYTQNIWPDETTPIQFHLRMPTDMTSHGVGAPTYNNAEMTMTYTSPDQAVNQQDIIFGGINMNHKTYMGYYGSKGGAPVVMYHALTGVKFAIANTDAELADIYISKISFKGLKNTGTFTFDATDNSFSWGSGATADPADNVIYQTFDENDLLTFNAETPGNNKFADSFYSAGTKNNLNKADASYTFWLVPQEITNSDATMRIEFTQAGANDYIEIRLGDLHASNWQAGQLRTYTFKVDEVNLKVRDDVTLHGSADDGFSGSVKSNVTITNTGNTRAFIRAAFVGQWLDSNNDPVFGFTDEVNRLYLVESWYEDQFVTKTGATAPHRSHGIFAGLAGYDQNNPYNDWQLCEDGYYYYMLPVETVNPEVSGSGTTKPLFTSYTVGTMPQASIGGAVLPGASMHFELEISTQAIAANKLDGTPEAWDEAWKKALGAKPVKKQ